MSCFVSLDGNVGQDPEMRSTQNGTSMLKFSIGNNLPKKDGQPITNWYRITVWGKDADYFADKIVKGDKILVHGVLEINTYVANDNTHKTSNDINAKSITLLTNRPAQPTFDPGSLPSSPDPYNEIPF